MSAIYKIAVFSIVISLAGVLKAANIPSKSIDRLFIACGSLDGEALKLKCFTNLNNKVKTNINTELEKLTIRDRQHALNTSGLASAILKENCQTTFTGWRGVQCILNANISLYNQLLIEVK